MNIFQVTEGNNQSTNKVVNTVGAGVAGQDNPNTNIDPQGNPLPGANPEEPTVVVDGPLGRVYTQALNLVYAKEDIGAIDVVIDAAVLDEAQMKEKAPTGTFVYAVDGDKLTGDECVSITNWLTKKKSDNCGDLIISLEVHKNIPQRSGLVEDIAKANGAKVVYSQKSLINTLSSKLKK